MKQEPPARFFPPAAGTKKVLIAGGVCGITMQIAAGKIEDVCRERKIRVNVKVHNLWESHYPGEGFDVIIEMFKFFENQNCPVINGQPFFTHQGEKELVREIADMLEPGGGYERTGG